MDGRGGPGGHHGLFEDMEVDEDPFISMMGGVNPGRGPRRAFSFNPHDSGRSAKSKPQDAAVVRDLYVTLEEVARGVTKKMKITRNVTRNDHRGTQREEKILTIDVKPGWKEGTKVTFEKEGDQIPGKIPADIAFVIRDKPHPVFKRDASNIIYTAKVSLKDALCGTRVSVPTLTGQNVSLNLSREIIKPQTTKRLQGHGLPLPKEPHKKGDLIVHFDIQFPPTLTESAREILAEILP